NHFPEPGRIRRRPSDHGDPRRRPLRPPVLAEPALDSEVGLSRFTRRRPQQETEPRGVAGRKRRLGLRNESAPGELEGLGTGTARGVALALSQTHASLVREEERWPRQQFLARSGRRHLQRDRAESGAPGVFVANERADAVPPLREAQNRVVPERPLLEAPRV